MSTTDVAYEPEVEANPSTFIQREKCNACGMRGYTTDMAYKITGPIPSPGTTSSLWGSLAQTNVRET